MIFFPEQTCALNEIKRFTVTFAFEVASRVKLDFGIRFDICDEGFKLLGSFLSPTPMGRPDLRAYLEI